MILLPKQDHLLRSWSLEFQHIFVGSQCNPYWKLTLIKYLASMGTGLLSMCCLPGISHTCSSPHSRDIISLRLGTLNPSSPWPFLSGVTPSAGGDSSAMDSQGQKPHPGRLHMQKLTWSICIATVYISYIYQYHCYVMLLALGALSSPHFCSDFV